MARSRGRKAWLVTWEWSGEHAVVPEKDVVVAVLRPQYSPERVLALVELLYATREYDATDKLAALSYNPYPARFNTAMLSLPGGEMGTARYLGQIVCGHNPYLYARLVDNLRASEAGSGIGLIWDERPMPGSLE